MDLPSTLSSKVSFDEEILILTLQLEDIEAQRASQTGKWPEGSPPDDVLALLDFENEINKAIQKIGDLKLAHSIAQAVDTDGRVLEQITDEESRATQDRDIALKLEDNDTDNPDLSTLIENKAIDDSASWVSWSDLDLKHMEPSVCCEDVESTWENLSSKFAGPSDPYSMRQKQVFDQLQTRMLECVVCTNKFHPHKTVRLECPERHVYCKACLKHRFILSISDESLFPPKCCGTIIPVDLVTDQFTPDESKRFDDASEEFSTSNRVYCSRPSCNRFISTRFVVNDRARCNDCGHETCIHCKREAHSGECPSDEALQRFMAFATEQEWQRCFGCHAMVERLHGCNHMT